MRGPLFRRNHRTQPPAAAPRMPGKTTDRHPWRLNAGRKDRRAPSVTTPSIVRRALRRAHGSRISCHVERFVNEAWHSSRARQRCQAFLYAHRFGAARRTHGANVQPAGVAGIHLEDQELPRLRPSFASRPSCRDDGGKAAAVAAKRDRDFVIIARTDAACTAWPEGFAAPGCNRRRAPTRFSRALGKS